MIPLDEIRQGVKGTISLSEPLAGHTWMKVGGPADAYVEPVDADDLTRIVLNVRSHGIPMLLLGRGSNMLVSDEGFRGVVINLESGLSHVHLDGDLVVAEGGVRITKFVDFCIQHSLAGVEMLAGIPGSVGGAVVMNAGAHGGEIADHIVDVDIIGTNGIERVQKGACGFRYRHSRFEGETVVRARFRLPEGDRETLGLKRKELIQKRNASQPLELPNLGSMFKNPAGHFAARLIEEAGLKGKRIGDAQVSEKHANFMVNLGNATATEVIQLIDLVKRTVYQHSGVQLELEVKLVGFPQEASAS